MNKLVYFLIVGLAFTATQVAPRAITDAQVTTPTTAKATGKEKAGISEPNRLVGEPISADPAAMATDCKHPPCKCGAGSHPDGGCPCFCLLNDPESPNPLDLAVGNVPIVQPLATKSLDGRIPSDAASVPHVTGNGGSKAVVNAPIRKGCPDDPRAC